MDITILKQKVAEIPDVPGIYRFQDAQGLDLYIGKASSLKKRLVSYLKAADPRIKTMIRSAQRLAHIETDSDIEALILESKLIKQQRPRFNIVLRDDKQYFYVAFTDDEFPRVFLTHQTSGRIKQKNYRIKEYIGPFTDGAALKTTLKFLRGIFPYCTCSQKHHNFCLNYHIGKCIGFCCLKSHETMNRDADVTWDMIHATYLTNIKALRDILSGKKNSLVKELKKRMETAGKKHHFKEAIELRDKIERLERVFYNAQIIKHSEVLKAHSSGLQKFLKTRKPIIRIEGYDVSNIQGTHATGSMVTFVNGTADKNFYRKFNINPPAGGRPKANDTAMLREIIERRFNHPEWPFPDLILIDGGKGQVNSALASLKDMGISVPVIGISKDERHMGSHLVTRLDSPMAKAEARRVPGRFKIIPLTKLSEADKNLLLSVDGEAHRFAIQHYRHRHGRSFR